MSAGATAARGYRLVLPPGWRRIPLRTGTDAAVQDILDRSFEGLPADRFGPIRREVARRLDSVIRSARQTHGLDLYLPVDRVHGVTLPASFLVGETTFATGGESAEVLSVLLTGRTSSPVLVDGAAAVRIDRPAAETPRAADELAATRRVEYLVPVPGRVARWVTVGFSTTAPQDGQDGDLATILVDLFDAVMTTWRWTGAEEPAG